VIEDWQPFTLHFGFDDWEQVGDRPSQLLGFGMFGVCFAWREVDGHRALDFTRRYTEDLWEGQDHRIRVGEPEIRP